MIIWLAKTSVKVGSGWAQTFPGLLFIVVLIERNLFRIPFHEPEIQTVKYHF